jgi:hypothetical protein
MEVHVLMQAVNIFLFIKFSMFLYMKIIGQTWILLYLSYTTTARFVLLNQSEASTLENQV